MALQTTLFLFKASDPLLFFLELSIRGKIQDAIYKAIGVDQ
mgnify:CR=1 FL=1